MLVDIITVEGVLGRSYALAYVEMAAPMLARIIQRIAEHVTGDRVIPVAIKSKLTDRFTLLGTEGLVGMALAAFDVALWDALAKAAEMPLVEFAGGNLQEVRAYNSNGLSIKEPEALADESLELLEEGFSAVKLRLGRSDKNADIAAVRAVRNQIPGSAVLMADFNQALTATEAVQRGQDLDDEGIYWFEEPIRHDDYAGAAIVAQRLTTPIQLGENFNSVQSMATAISMQSCDLVMPDLMRIGGITGWLQATVLAKSVAIPMSSHLYPEVSVHLLALTQTRDWLEFVDWAAPVLVQPLIVENGMVRVPNRPGVGIEWVDDAVRYYEIK